MDNHLKNECHQRLIYCDHCDKEMYFIELSVRIISSDSTYLAILYVAMQSHTQECYNAPRICRNCKKEIPASQVYCNLVCVWNSQFIHAAATVAWQISCHRIQAILQLHHYNLVYEYFKETLLPACKIFILISL